MYSTDGDFGKVRLVAQIRQETDGLLGIHNAGWHHCNDKYRVQYTQGSDYALIMVTISGRGWLRVSGKEYDLPPGSITLIPRHTPCAYRTPKDGYWEFYWLHPAGPAANYLVDSMQGAGSHVVTGVDTVTFTHTFEQLLRVGTEHPPEHRILISQIVSQLLHMTMLERIRSKPDQQLLISQRTIQYLEQHYMERISIDALAAELYLSASHLIREFRKETGTTPHAYLESYRLSHAEQLLRFTRIPIAEIARRTGFCSASHFISRFRSHRGIAPAAYRRKIAQDSVIPY